MKRNDLAFVPPETSKRVILYPTQDVTNHQQTGQLNVVLPVRPKTSTIPVHSNEPNSTSNTQSKSFRQFSHSSQPNGGVKQTEKSKIDDSVTIIPAGQSTATSASLRVQNPYYANPFFRPKIVSNQSAVSSNVTESTTTINREPSSLVNGTVPLQASSTSSINVSNNRGRATYLSKGQNAVILSPARANDSDITLITAANQDDSRNWAHSVAPTSIARRVINDDRSKPMINSSTSNISNGTIGDPLKQKVTSTTDIVISLMDPLRLPVNNTNSSSVNILARPIMPRDDSVLTGPSNSNNHENGTAPSAFASTATSSGATNNYPDWRKNLTVRYQQNTRNIATAKIFQSKQAPVPVPPTTNPDPVIAPPVKSDRTLGINSNHNERTFQASDSTPAISLLIRKSSEIVRVSKQDNNNIERSASMQVSPSPYSNLVNPDTIAAAAASTAPIPDENDKSKESTNPESVAHPPISIPPALISAKPSVNVEQQKAIITRVMIRRDFVKSTESRPPMPSAAQMHSFIVPQSTRPRNLTSQNVAQTSNNTNNNNEMVNSSYSNNTNNNQIRINQPAQNQYPLSQKSQLSFTSPNPANKDMRSNEQYRQYPMNGTQNLMSPSSNRIASPLPTGANAAVTFRSNSLSATPAENRKKKDETMNVKTKKRSISASTTPKNA